MDEPLEPTVVEPPEPLQDEASETVLVATAESSTKGIPVSVIRRSRRVQRWEWEDPAITRARLWNIPEEESTESEIAGLHRIIISEAGTTSNVNDARGIWEVVRNVRNRSCDRNRIQTITECDENGETLLSAMRRSQRRAMGMVSARTRRHRWIRNLTVTCEAPEGFPDHLSWTRGRPQRGAPTYQQGCLQTAQLASDLVRGIDRRQVTGRAIAIAWGGRCERNGGACDDPLACRRGLARIPNTDTDNALWCRVGSRGCSDWVEQIGENGEIMYFSDPVCAALNVLPRRPPSPPTTLASADPTLRL
jgi:hypothetical protein